MLTFALQSGSNGNCIYVEAGDTGLLIDAGISGRQVKLRLAEHGRSIQNVSALLITHDHHDHSRHAGVYERLFGLPSYMTAATHEKIKPTIGKVRKVKRFCAGETLEINDVRVHTIRTPHDAVDGVAFIIEHDGKRLGVFTDLGHPFPALADALTEVDAAYLESNYDPEMLANGPYPAMLQRRIRGEGGHLSNAEAAGLLQRCDGRLKWVALAHLSNENNTPDLAVETHRRLVGADLPLSVARRFIVSELLTI